MNNYNYSNDAKSLKLLAMSLSDDARKVASVVIDDPKFSIWPGGLDNHHHNYVGGLSKHTLEVYNLAVNSRNFLNVQIDDVELFFACLFHDAGKLYDYIPDTNSNHDWKFAETPLKFIGSPHKRLIHHVSRSALIWSHAVSDFPELNDKYHDTVLHAILAHHGQREFGSPVAPKTKLAWLLHLSDGISARMEDCDRSDIIKH